MSDPEADRSLLDTVIKPILITVASAVVVALVVGGTSPWWWNEIFGDGDPTTTSSSTSTSNGLAGGTSGTTSTTSTTSGNSPPSGPPTVTSQYAERLGRAQTISVDSMPIRGDSLYFTAVSCETLCEVFESLPAIGGDGLLIVYTVVEGTEVGWRSSSIYTVSDGRGGSFTGELIIWRTA